MRLALASALVVLVAVAAVVSGLGHAPPRVFVSAASQAPVPPSPVAAATTPPPVTATVPAGPVPRPTAGGGCGLALAAGATAGPVGQCTVLEVGDSLGSNLGWGLSRVLGTTAGLNFVQLDRASTGLANASFYDWPGQLAADLAQYHPQLVLVCLGGNDEQGMTVGGSAVEFPSPAWQAAYVQRAGQVVKEATAAGAYVMWVGMPIMEPSGYSAGMQVLNGLYAQAVSADPDAVFVPVWQLFADPSGRYRSVAVVNDAAQGLRQPDGIHFTYAGEDVFATYVIGQIAAQFHVQLAPANPATITGWE